MAAAIMVALSIGRLAAIHRHPDATRGMAVYLLAGAKLLTDEREINLHLAEAIAWLHRASLSGDDQADEILEELTIRPRESRVLAMAAQFARVLP